MRTSSDGDAIAFYWNMPPGLDFVQGCFVKEQIAGRLGNFDITDTSVGT
jgi:hypothetical protein